jgi:cation transport ATPase
MLTGESTQVSKNTGAEVIGSAINGEGSLIIEVKGTGKDLFLSQVIDLVKQAQESNSKTQDLANTAAMWLTLIALSGGAITFENFSRSAEFMRPGGGQGEVTLKGYLRNASSSGLLRSW